VPAEGLAHLDPRWEAFPRLARRRGSLISSGSFPLVTDLVERLEEPVSALAARTLALEAWVH